MTKKQLHYTKIRLVCKHIAVNVGECVKSLFSPYSAMPGRSLPALNLEHTISQFFAK